MKAVTALLSNGKNNRVHVHRLNHNHFQQQREEYRTHKSALPFQLPCLRRQGNSPRTAKVFAGGSSAKEDSEDAPAEGSSPLA